MSLSHDLLGVVNDAGTWVSLKEKGREPRRVFMICKEQYGGFLDVSGKIMDWAETSSFPTGASFGYGLMMAEDAPADMREKAEFEITDGLDRRWRVDAARPIVDVLPDGTQRVAAWRMLLRGTQRGIR